MIGGVEMTAKSRLGRVLLWAIPVAALAALFASGPISQPQDYHQFADRRTLLGIPHFANVVSNLAFLLAGGLGLNHCIRHRPDGARAAWVLFFGGFVLVAFGSAYYHADPNNGTLVWDRMAMGVGFAGIYTALVAEYVSPRLEKFLLAPALLGALGSVLFWHVTDDLRLYFAVQGTIFISALVIVICFESATRQTRFLLIALAAYGLAIVCEQLDGAIFTATLGVTGGHAVKHLLAALAAYVLYRMQRKRANKYDIGVGTNA